LTFYADVILEVIFYLGHCKPVCDDDADADDDADDDDDDDDEWLVQDSTSQRTGVRHVAASRRSWPSSTSK